MHVRASDRRPTLRRGVLLGFWVVRLEMAPTCRSFRETRPSPVDLGAPEHDLEGAISLAGDRSIGEVGGRSSGTRTLGGPSPQPEFLLNEVKEP
jgi:hypothetical protein